MRKIFIRTVLVVAALAAAGGFGQMVWAMMNEAKPDSQGCLPGRQAVHNVLLVDASDPIAEGELQRLIRLLNEIVAATGARERFSMLFIGDGTASFLHEKTSFCMLDSGGSIYKDRQLAELLADSLDQLDELGEAELDRSPILESIEMLLNRRDIFGAESVRLWAVSDYLQNGRISFYPGSSRYQRPDSNDLPSSLLPPQGRFDEVHLIVLPRVRFNSLQQQAVPFFLAYVGQFSNEKPNWEFF